MNKKSLILVFSLFFLLFLQKVFSQESQVIRVGFFQFDGYHMQDDQGIRSGYGYEVLQHMAGYAGFQYEYIGYDKSWAEMQEMLANNEIDILTSAQKTESRLAKFYFSELSIGSSAAILTIKEGNTDYLMEDYSHWSGMRIGMIENNSRNISLKEFANEKNFTYQEVFYSDTQEMIKDLKEENNIDAILTSNLRSITDEIIIAQFDASPFYVMVNKGNKELLDRVNFAIDQMDNYESGFRTLLMTKYYTPSSGIEIAFNAEERDFINRMKDKTFTAVLNPDREPYSYILDNKLTGTLLEPINKIINRSQLNINLLTPKNRAEYWQMIEDKTTDIRFDSGMNHNLAEQYGYWITPSYMEIPIARVSLRDTKDFHVAGVVRNSDITSKYTEIIQSLYKEIILFDSVDSLLNSVKNKEVDLVILPIALANVAVRNDIKNQLISEVIVGLSIFYSVAVSYDCDPLVFSILKKTINSLSEEELNSMSQKYMDNLEKPFTLIGFIYTNPLSFIFIIIGIILGVILVIQLLSLSKRQQKALEQIEKEKATNIALQEAVIKAEQTTKAKSSFMSRMSHEIRTPLNAIIGYNSIAKNQITEAKTEVEHRQAEMRTIDCLTKSEIASRHLLTIINDVLDMSAIESGKITIAHERFDFKGLITNLTTVFYSQAKLKNIKLEVVFDTLTEEWFIGDQMRVNQVLTNLIGNAIKFTPDGGLVKLSICQSEIKGNSTHIHFEIMDTGIGMSDEQLDHIWKPFEQADSTISRRFGGTGLGLSITKNLIDLMNGKISVESTLGKGSTFKLDLSFEHAEQPESAATFNFSSIKALIVDDDKSTCDYIELLFNKFGARCQSVTSGQEAVIIVQKAKENHEDFTVCLVDWRMPKMDGIETVKEIRKITGDSIPIIVITAYDFSEIAEKAAEIGVNTFLSKPLFQSSLFDLLANLSGNEKIKEIEKTKEYRFNKERILLAEDNEMNMEIAISILQTADFVIDTVTNGQEAVDKFESMPAGTYKLILMDVQMPVINGHEATKIIRSSKHQDATTIPIIAMSADAFAENVAQALEAGMNDHIAKPINIQNLFDTLKKYL